MNSEIQHKITSAIPSSCERHGPKPSVRVYSLPRRDDKHPCPKTATGWDPKSLIWALDGFKNLEEGSIPSLQI
ncbi:hypothetical protein BYT27DRAFT_7190369 [Phlegmacium glaucopus]|nr:hypothetical protein BYT27DRAFT_7190369 [Phlegmacium glaucopus]